MFTDEIADPESVDPGDVRAKYASTLAEVVETVGVETAAERTGVSEARIAALRDGGDPEFTVEEAAEVLALSDARPDAEALLAELRDHVMLEMSSAVVDVDTLAADLDLDLDAKEIQQRIEGRQSMTLAEYAAIHRYLAAENPW